MEIFLDGHGMDRPKTVLIPAPLNKLDKLIARVFMPEWIVDAKYYMILEAYLAKIFMLERIPDRLIPVLTLPNALYDEFMKQNRLTLDPDWRVKKRKALVLYELVNVQGTTRLRLLDDGKQLFDFIVHLERRRDA